jgi:hypothetical protein
MKVNFRRHGHLEKMDGSCHFKVDFRRHGHLEINGRALSHESQF